MTRTTMLGLLYVSAICFSGIPWGCKEADPFEPLGRNRKERLLICPDHFLVCALRPEHVTDHDGKTRPTTTTTPDYILLESPRTLLQEYLNVRPEHPSFRALCGLLNRIGDWSSLVLMEDLNPYRNAPDDLSKEYGFVLLVETPKGFQAYTNADDHDEDDKYGLDVRPLKVDAAKARGFLGRMEKVHSRLPAALVGGDGMDAPTLVVHYIARGVKWSCAVHRYHRDVLLGRKAASAKDDEIVGLMSRPRPDTRGSSDALIDSMFTERERWQQAFRDVALSREQEHLLDTIKNRYTRIASEMLDVAPPWPSTIARFKSLKPLAGESARADVSPDPNR